MQTRLAKRKSRETEVGEWQLKDLNWKATDPPQKAWRVAESRRCRRKLTGECFETISQHELDRVIRFPSSTSTVTLRVHSRSIVVPNPSSIERIFDGIHQAIKMSDDPDHIYFEGIAKKNGRYVVTFGS